MTTHLVNTVTWNSRKLSSYSSRGQKSTVFIFLGLQGGLLLGASVQGLVRGAVGGVCFLPFRDSGGSPLSWAPGPFPPSSKPAMAESLSHCILWHSLSCLLLLHTEGSFIQRDIILGTARWCSSNIIAPIFKSSTQQPNSPLACNTVTGSGDYDIDIFGGWVKISSFFSFREKENAPPPSPAQVNGPTPCWRKCQKAQDLFHPAHSCDPNTYQSTSHLPVSQNVSVEEYVTLVFVAFWSCVRHWARWILTTMQKQEQMSAYWKYWNWILVQKLDKDNPACKW